MPEFRIESLDAEGRGVAHGADGKVVFVEGALPGEQVEAEFVEHRKRFDLARTRSVLHASSGRRDPHCPHFGVCGGCATQHADARTQVAAKQRWLEDALRRIGKVSAAAMLAPIYGAEWGYRHRARLSVYRVEAQGGVRVGFRERRSSHVADLRECPVLPDAVSRLIRPLGALVDTLSLPARIPQVELAVAEAQTVLVVRHLDPLTAQDEQKLHAFAALHGVRFWLQSGGPDTARALGEAQALDYTLPEFNVRIAFAPTDFTQVNHAVNRILVSRAVRLIEPRAGERIGDFYCGLGNFTLPLARSGASLLGVEGSDGLVARARANAALNGLSGQARFECMNLQKIDPAAMARLGPLDKILIDPPREGAMEALKALPEDWPRRIVYVSCDPATLARDAGMLVHTKGYALSCAGVVNMFPHTKHVESIAVFDR